MSFPWRFEVGNATFASFRSDTCGSSVGMFVLAHWYVSRFMARTTALEYKAHLYAVDVMSALSSHPISMEGPHLPYCGAFAWLSGASNDCTPSV